MRLCSKSLISVLHRPLSVIFPSFVTLDELVNAILSKQRNRLNLKNLELAPETHQFPVKYQCRASLTSASHLPQTPPPFCDWLYSDRLHTID
ncbi:hypothetical protein T03_13547, partial [Trichinella britovi]